MALSKMLRTPLFRSFIPCFGLLKVLRNCGRIFLTTCLTTSRKFFILISGCGPVGRALDLGSRRREFESPHSDQKSGCFHTKTATFLAFYDFNLKILAYTKLELSCIPTLVFPFAPFYPDICFPFEIIIENVCLKNILSCNCSI